MNTNVFMYAFYRTMTDRNKPVFHLIPTSVLNLEAADAAVQKYYDKIVAFDRHDYIHTLPPKHALRSVGYLYSNATARKLDHKTLNGLTPIRMYGYHNYGGYHGFFTPDIVEVFWLLLERVTPQQLDACKHIYCTTTAYPSLSVSACYDARVDRHKALSTAWLASR